MSTWPWRRGGGSDGGSGDGGGGACMQLVAAAVTAIATALKATAERLSLAPCSIIMQNVRGKNLFSCKFAPYFKIFEKISNLSTKNVS